MAIRSLIPVSESEFTEKQNPHRLFLQRLLSRLDLLKAWVLVTQSMEVLTSVPDTGA